MRVRLEHAEQDPLFPRLLLHGPCLRLRTLIAFGCGSCSHGAPLFQFLLFRDLFCLVAGLLISARVSVFCFLLLHDAPSFLAFWFLGRLLPLQSLATVILKFCCGSYRSLCSSIFALIDILAFLKFFVHSQCRCCCCHYCVYHWLQSLLLPFSSLCSFAIPVSSSSDRFAGGQGGRCLLSVPAKSLAQL